MVIHKLFILLVLDLVSIVKADFLSSQKPLAASKQVLASSQNNFLSSHEYDNLINIGLAGLSNRDGKKSSYYDHSTTYGTCQYFLEHLSSGSF